MTNTPAPHLPQRPIARPWHAPLLLAALSLLGCGRSGPGAAPAANAATATPADTIEIVFTYGSEKEGWIRELTAQFHQARKRIADGRTVTVTAVPLGSGECIDEILSGRRKTHLTSPASAAFIKLANARSRAESGKDLVPTTENLVLSPVVIAMWKPMAEALGWPQRPVGWSDILALARDPRGWGGHGHPEWGAFRFGHTHPEFSNSGLIAVLAEAYAAAGKVAGLTAEDLRKPETAAFIGGIEQAVVHYGSSTGFFGKRMFAGGPGYLSAAVLYENMVIESYDPKNQLPFPIVAIYPREGTFWSDHPVGVVDREWVTPAHREAAALYTDFLLARPQQERAINFGFRPADPAVTMAAPIDAPHGVDPREPKTTLEVPSPEVLQMVLETWRANKKHARVVLAIDVSGSMKDGGKMEQARLGAAEFVALLGDQDELSLLLFRDEVSWVSQDTVLAQSRATLQGQIRGLYADGGTALNDALGQACRHLVAKPASGASPHQIDAVVFLTDGKDTDSKNTFESVLDTIRYNNERPSIRVFTIGYGDDADGAVLGKIAEATNGRYYTGKSENIREVFKEIATFF